MKKILFYLYLIFLSSPAVYADVIWPALYITKGMLSLKVIILGLIIETLFVKIFTKTDWKKSCLVSVLMNLITSLLGIILIPLFGLLSELVFDFVFHSYDKFGIGTFHWSHWLVSYIMVIILNTLIEAFVIKKALKLNYKNILWWLFIANAISVLICFLMLII